MRIRKRPDAKTRCLYPEDVVASIGSLPKPPSEQEEGEVSSKPAAASEAAEEKDPELERRKYKHLGWLSSITFSFIQTKTPTQDSSTNPDNNEDGNEDEVQSKSEKNKRRLSKTMVIGGGSGYVEDEKYEQFYNCKMRNSYTGFPSTKETLSSDSSRQGDVTGTFLLNDEYGEESGDSEKNCKTRSLNSIYKRTQNLNPVYNSKEENEMPIIGQSKKLKSMQRGETNQG